LFTIVINQIVDEDSRILWPQTSPSVLPKVVEAVGGELGVKSGVLDVTVPEIVLDGSGTASDETAITRPQKISPVAWQSILFLGRYLFHGLRQPINLNAVLATANLP
jgi:hypothetical protein